MGEFSGRVALVTGAARGIGRALAVEFAAAGADVVATDIVAQVDSVPIGLAEPSDLDHTRKLVEQKGSRCLTATVDVRDADQVRAAFDEAVEEFGRVDVVCANAGIWSTAPLLGMPDATWRDMIDTDLTGVFHTLREAARVMVPRESGRIVVTGSVAARMGTANMAHYTAAKWGVIGLVKSAALELAPHGITVNVVAPSFTNTAMINNSLNYHQFSPDDPTPDAAARVWAQLMPMRVPYVEPEEVARTALFLASDAARHISASTVDIAAGWNANYTA
ncbi:mycofactocin-coupled SDR family oxidoreductase [Saccharothrix sp. S26]|uniref:mycofactocin-coupled SDR family oxidoreductase n=1 Tax=Saccharothrix sp. S26 TaxID=2907215 RepID=UPI001F214020|nr:mycofactocin-coupled SDR family oxidoreductase [Saccharothrix sp. S26]MCE6996349.1 mycofactocin-coupled SDR family oxidoreductase [Saccharothrix sp. S26]